MMVNGGSPVAYTIADRNKLTAVGSNAYTYDALGNLTGQTAGADTLQYTYDTEGRLHTVRENGAVVASYSYDAAGNRVKSVEGDETIHYIYDGLGVIQEIRPTSGGARTDYVFGFGRQLARVDNATAITATTIYVTGDHLGSSSILTNAVGAVVGRYAYDPYGQILTDTTGAVGQAYKYTGKPLSSATGLYYYGARWYDPAVGRFTSQDPARDGGNWYQYGNGNPLTNIDPDGLNARKFEIANQDGAGCGFLVPLVYYAIQKAPSLLTYLMNNWETFSSLVSQPKGTGKLADTGYKTFNALKKVLGTPGEDRAWHHIVEQSQIKKSGFASELINNVKNVLSIDNATHAKISGFYNSIQPFSQGMRVRDWLAGQSFEEQFKFGLEQLMKFGVDW